jgi:hypothetical protein
VVQLASPGARPALELAGSVHIGAVLDGYDLNAVGLVIDAVDDPVITAPRAEQAFQAKPQRLADPALRAGAVQATP